MFEVNCIKTLRNEKRLSITEITKNYVIYIDVLSRNTMMDVYSHITTSTQEDAMENFATYIDNQ